MALTDLLHDLPAAPQRLPHITCSHFDPDRAGRRCRSYLPNGSCARPDEFMCVEWLKLNANRNLAPVANCQAHSSRTSSVAGNTASTMRALREDELDSVERERDSDQSPLDDSQLTSRSNRASRNA